MLNAKILKNCFGIALLIPTVAFAKPRVSVTSLQNKANGSSCYWSHYRDLGEGMAEQLITKLSEMGRYEILEREHIRKIYNDEHELINSDKSTAPQAKKFRAAQYTIAGAVTSFEYCANGAGAKVNVGKWIGFGDLSVGGKRESAKVVLDLRVIDVATGKVLKSVQAEGSVSRGKIAADGLVKGVDFGSNAFYKTPLGEATRDAISKAAEKVATVLPNDGKEDVETGVTATHVVCEKDGASCDPAKAFKQNSSGETLVFNLKTKKKSWTKSSQVFQLEKLKKAKSVDEGEDVFVQEKGEQFEKCTVLEKTKNEQKLVAQCGNDDPATYEVARLFVAKK